MGDILIWGLIVLFLFYAVLPWCITRVFSLGVFQKGHSKGEIALTFDDGPDPRYTPALLNLLKKYGVKATFFVLGSKAERFPKLLTRIHKDGHKIGIHNYLHHANSLMTPGQVRRQLERSFDIVEKITGERTEFYRPPWGLLNLFDLKKRKQYKIILWSVMVGDWNSKVGAEKLKERLLGRITDGSVIVLHDSGDTWGADEDAPVQMLEALEDVLKKLKMQGYKFIRIDEMVYNHRERGESGYESVGTNDYLSRLG